jgi:hypothetical protein
MRPTLLTIIEDFGRLWNVHGFAALLASRLADPPADRDGSPDPCGIVLEEHRRLLIAALKRAGQQPELAGCSDMGTLADAFLGLYLVRRLRGDRLEGWAEDAIGLLRGSQRPIDPYARGDAR